MIVDNGYRLETGMPENIFSRLFNDKYFVTLEALSSSSGSIRVSCNGLAVAHNINDKRVLEVITSRYSPKKNESEKIDEAYMSKLSNFTQHVKEMIKSLDKEELANYEFLNGLV